jgi:WD40 repeat protein
MPNFPSYRGELPEALNPLNPRHYWLLAYWVYFRPTAFHFYLYQAAPDVYQLRGYQKFLKTWRVPAYRNVYLMLPIAIALPSILVALSMFMYFQSGVQNDTAWVTSIAVTPNGQIAITASGERDFDIKVPTADSTLKVWDLRQGSQIQTLVGHDEGVTAVAVTPDGQKAVSASRDRTLKLWDIRKGTQLHTLKGHTHWLTSIAVTPDGQRAVSAAADKTLKVWDLQTGEELHTLKGHTDIVWAVALTPDGHKAISASADQTLKVWDIEQGKQLYTLTGHNGWVTGVAINSDGQQAISTSSDQTLKVWDIEQGKELYTLAGHNGWITDVALSPDGQHAVSASNDQTLRIWDIEQGKALHTLSGHKGWVTSVALTPDGQQAVSASSDHTLKVWDIEQGKVLQTLKGHRSWITAIAMIPNKRRVFSASFDRYPKLWSLNRGTEVPMAREITKSIAFNAAFSIVLILAAIATAVSLAIILAVGVIVFGAAGGLLTGLGLVFLGSPICGFAYLVVNRVASNPLLKEAQKAVQISSALTIIFAIVFGMIVGVIFGLTNRKALGVFASIVFILASGVAIGIVVACMLTGTVSFKGRFLPAIRAGTAVSVSFNLLVALGALRIPFYPFELLVALLSRFRRKWHPVIWDELLVLPVLGTSALLQAQLRASERKGLQLAADVICNPFQRAGVQRALHSYLHSVSAPLHVLYELLSAEDLNTYVVAPISKRDWQLLPTTRQVLLGEVGKQWVDCSSSGVNQVAENLVWGLTWLGRKHQQTPVTRFAGLLYQLSYTEIVKAKNFNLSSYEKIYGSLTQYPGGVEIADSFEVLASFLTYEKLSDLSVAREVVSAVSVNETSIRPSVLKALTRCGEIGAEVLTYQHTATTNEKLAVLVRLIRALDTLDEYVVEQVVAPEQAIFRRIIHQWRAIVSQALAETEKRA